MSAILKLPHGITAEIVSINMGNNRDKEAELEKLAKEFYIACAGVAPAAIPMFVEKLEAYITQAKAEAGIDELKRLLDTRTFEAVITPQAIQELVQLKSKSGEGV